MYMRVYGTLERACATAVHSRPQRFKGSNRVRSSLVVTLSTLRPLAAGPRLSDALAGQLEVNRTRYAGCCQQCGMGDR